MTRQRLDARSVCYASLIVLSLSACSQHGAKLKSQNNITENPQATTTPDAGGEASRWVYKKNGKSLSAKSNYGNLWERLFDLYGLPPTEHPDIDRELSWFINHPTYLDRVQQRAEPFLYSIVKQVEKHEIPGELALLPVIESAFQPHAVSPARAAGIWQFIPSTGRVYGLKKSPTYDGRRDVYASTKAAIKYLKKLHNDFNGDWLLAIAAYNCGEGAVGRAIQRNISRGLPTDFWSLDLPQETRSYVPRLLAVARLFADADHYGVDLHDIPNTAKYKPVKVNTQLDLALAADAANMSLDQLYELNPGFKGKYADVPGSFHLFIPAEKKTSEFRETLEKLILENRTAAPEFSDDPNAPPVEPRSSRESDSADPSWAGANAPESRPVSFASKSLQSMQSIPATETRAKPSLASAAYRAASEKPPVRAEKRSAREPVMVTKPAPMVNKDVAKLGAAPAKLAGKTAGLSGLTTSGLVAEKAVERLGKRTAYTVQPGETLWAVARKHSVGPYQLAQWNQIPVTTNVRAGQSLVVWNKDVGRKTSAVLDSPRLGRRSQ